jgi:Spy/CpxP family protein refolding chaperone
MAGHEIGFYVKVLGITDDQKTQMKAVLQKEHPTMKPLMQQMHQLNSQLKQYEEGTFDAAKVQTLVAAQSQTLVQIKVNEARIHSELYQLLTSDQQAKLKELQAARQAKMQQHAQNEGEPAPEQ